MTTTLVQDIRYAVRRLARSPGFTAVALLTLGLGIGATSAIFSVVNGVLLRPLPFPDPDRIVRVFAVNPERGVEQGVISPLELDDWQAAAPAFGSLAAWFVNPANLTGGGEAEVLPAAFVTGEFFGMLGTPTRHGRPIGPEEVAGEARTVVISERLWRQRFGSAPDVLGSSLTVDGEPLTVIGVMPGDFRFPEATTDLWMPVSLITEDGIPRRRDVRWLSVAGRLAPGATAEQATAQLGAVALRLERDHPDSNAGWSAATLVDLRSSLVGDVGRALIVTLLAVGFVLLMVCLNLGNLLLARATARAREIEIRRALGAGRGRIVRQLLTESIVLALFGGLLGLATAFWATGAIRTIAAGTLPRTADIVVDASVLGFSFAIALAAGVAFGLIPALRVARSPAALRSGARGSVGDDRNRVRAALVVGQVAIAIVLTAGAGLMVRNLDALRRVDAGIQTGGLIALQLRLPVPEGLPLDEFGGWVASRKFAFGEALAAVPGVTEVATSSAVPLGGGAESIPVSRPDADIVGGSELRVDSRFVSSDYFRVAGIPLLAGEAFPSGEPTTTELTAIISETAARRFWPGEDPVGRTLAVAGGQARVLGVVGDVRYEGLAAPATPTLYLHEANAPRTRVTYLVRTAGDPGAALTSVRQAVRAVDPDQPIGKLSTLENIVAETVSRDRFFTSLLALFGLLGLVIASVGLYGVLAFAVTQRTREIGVRVALGAQPGQVVRMIVGRGMGLVAIGSAVGLATALFATRLLEGLLPLVSTTDPLTFAAVPTTLALIGLLACLVPARRAARIDPMEALRAE